MVNHATYHRGQVATQLRQLRVAPPGTDLVIYLRSSKPAVTPEAEIQSMVDRETAAWDRQDADALVDLFHPDMVWPWPPDGDAHDPAIW